MERSEPVREKLDRVAAEYDDLVRILSRGDGKSAEFKNALKRIGEVEPLVKLRREIADNQAGEKATRLLIERETDRGLLDLENEELAALQKRGGELLEAARRALFPPDPEDEKNAIIEIRLGIGGEEASLFARDLFRMYAKYAEKKGFVAEIFNSHYSDLGGIKEIIFLVKGKGAYGLFKYESGVHRVQRIPLTESSGRIHTSAATVAVFPEAEDEEITVDPKDLKIDTFCASGAGGQHVNKTASAVRITHLPTGLVVSCQDERSQGQNRLRAMKILKARLQHERETETKDRLDSERKQQVKGGERSEKIRTYNFPQNRVSDHRAGLTLYHLDRIMEGDMDELIEGLTKEEKGP